MHFPLFQIPPIFEKVSGSVDNFPCFSTFPPVSRKLLFPPTFTNSPVFVTFTCFLHTLCVFRFSPTLTVMHLCITQCTCWTPLMLVLQIRLYLFVNLGIKVLWSEISSVSLCIPGIEGPFDFLRFSRLRSPCCLVISFLRRYNQSINFRLFKIEMT